MAFHNPWERRIICDNRVTGPVMDTRWKIKILSPLAKNLSKPQNAFLAALGDRLRAEGLNVISTESGRASISDRYSAIRDSDGIVILAFEQWDGRRTIGDKEEEAVMPSEFTHIGIVQATLRPYLIFREKSLSMRGALRNAIADAPIDVPKSLDLEWLKSERFSGELDGFLRKVRARRHVFQGYSSQSSEVANHLSRFLAEKLNLRVYDWKNFPVGRSVWENIEEAERLTNCGIFLFMEDDVIGNGRNKKLAPRDNVIFEAGYFAGAKRKSRSLVIREKDAKIPTDFGGILYLELPSRKSIAAIETKLTDQIERMLTGAD
jgi:hypothetical protein